MSMLAPEAGCQNRNPPQRGQKPRRAWPLTLTQPTSPVISTRSLGAETATQ